MLLRGVVGTVDTTEGFGRIPKSRCCVRPSSSSARSAPPSYIGSLPLNNAAPSAKCGWSSCAASWIGYCALVALKPLGLRGMPHPQLLLRAQRCPTEIRNISRNPSCLWERADTILLVTTGMNLCECSPSNPNLGNCSSSGFCTAVRVLESAAHGVRPAARRIPRFRGASRAFKKSRCLLNRMAGPQFACSQELTRAYTDLTELRLRRAVSGRSCLGVVAAPLHHVPSSSAAMVRLSPSQHGRFRSAHLPLPGPVRPRPPGRFIQQYLKTRIPVGPSQPQAASLREATSRSARGPGVHSVTGGARGRRREVPGGP